MVNAPQIFTAKVMHLRLFPKRNAFRYGVYYLVLPLPALPIPSLLASFHPKDLGKMDGSDPLPWVQSLLALYGLDQKAHKILLVTMPRVLGYVFNPVSFYLCLDDDQALRAVVCEVHNTFGEQHSYLCANPDHSPMTSDQWFEAEKVFHVSPFLPRTGSYKFRFDLKVDRLGIWIDYYDQEHQKQLLTSLLGSLQPLTARSLRHAFFRHPFVALKAISLIHWQALILFVKGVRYIAKPKQRDQTISTTRNLTKM